jgi:hypothetical protein
MTDTPEGAPSKRAMEVVPQVFIAAGHMPKLRLAEIERAARLLDAEFRKSRRSPMSYELKMALPNALTTAFLDEAEIMAAALRLAGVNEQDIKNDIGLALVHATSEWVMRAAEKPPADTPSPP